MIDVERRYCTTLILHTCPAAGLCHCAEKKLSKGIAPQGKVILTVRFSVLLITFTMKLYCVLVHNPSKNIVLLS